MDERLLGVGGGVPKGVVLKAVGWSNGKYAAGSDGHIYCYSDAKVNARKPKPFRLFETARPDGYNSVGVSRNGRRRTLAVHVMVCEAFYGPRQVGHCVRHLDGQKTLNIPENLAWGTFAQNEADKRRHGRASFGENHGGAKLTDEGVRIIRASIPFGLWNARDAAVVFGVSESRVRAIARGIGWAHA